MGLPKNKITVENTHTTVWQERDRLHIELLSESGRTLVEWWDEAAAEAIEDGFIDTRDCILGKLDSALTRGNRLHQSVFEYWDKHLGRPGRPVSIKPSKEQD